ncbi:MAG TPA: MFS transporter [Nitrososphaerales archaeon]|nr:MFS transporter [Nitrososphaerales archaeon]
MGSAAGPGPRKRMAWVYSAFPASLAAGPLGTLVQLYLIELNGVTLGTLYGSLAVAVFNGVSIPAAIFWGFATDRLRRTRAIVAGSYGILTVVLFTFYLDRTTAGTVLTYSIFSFVSAASATPLNLLIMETESKGRWAEAFAKLSMMSSVGSVGGLLLSTVWVEAFPLLDLAVPLALFSLASAVLAFLTIRNPSFNLEPETMVLRRPSFFQRLLALPLIFLTVPRVSDFRRVFRGLRSGLTNYVPLFYISIVLFYLSSGLFNTSFVPAMRSFGIPEGEIFAVMLAGMVVQTLAFQVAGRYVEQRSLVMSSVQGLLVRGLCYGGLGAAAVFLPGLFFLGPALVFYPLGAGIAFSVYYTASNTMMFGTVQGKNPGASLGVYSAVVGLAGTVGSLASGFISVYSGFYVTFTAASVLLYLAVFVVSRLPREPKSTTAAPAR